MKTHQERSFPRPYFCDSLGNPFYKRLRLEGSVDKGDSNPECSRQFSHLFPSIQSIRQTKYVDMVKAERRGMHELRRWTCRYLEVRVVLEQVLLIEREGNSGGSCLEYLVEGLERGRRAGSAREVEHGGMIAGDEEKEEDDTQQVWVGPSSESCDESETSAHSDAAAATERERKRKRLRVVSEGKKREKTSARGWEKKGARASSLSPVCRERTD